MQAFIMAHEDGCDVINASLGSDQGFPANAFALVAGRIAKSGVFVAIAGGNSGARGTKPTISLFFFWSLELTFSKDNISVPAVATESILQLSEA